jgi:hypothetical protein
MARILSFASSFFSAAFVILLVLGLLSVAGPVMADEPLLNPNLSDSCGVANQGCDDEGYCYPNDCCPCDNNDEVGCQCTTAMCDWEDPPNCT